MHGTRRLALWLIVCGVVWLYSREELSAQNLRGGSGSLPTCGPSGASLSDEDSSSAEETQGCELRVVSYNIRHGRGMDDQVDLERTARVLRTLQPDIIGLQEVDQSVRRSGVVNQPRELGRLLDMHPAFGKFMEFQGGEYGMGLLSRHPLRSHSALPLPEGNEPRCALVCEVELPTGETVLVINVHFDWVNDDRFRYAQAEQLAEFLDGLDQPWILLGDFNDQPGSRTLELFSSRAVEARKPEENRLTFSSTKPAIEIDFIFAAPAERWLVGEARVIDEPLASDHRPVLAVLRLLPPSP